MPIKASPLDIEMFRQEITVKYPTFTAPAVPAVPEAVRAPIATSKLAQAYSPIPVRHHYDHDESDAHHHGGLPQGSHPHPFVPGQQPNTGFRAMPQPATPAPSPPPSPKPKKQQFQTDQTRPFLFPFSRSALRQRNGRLVPFAIDEADRLYTKHMYVSLSLWQMWRTREECMSTESGLDRMPGSEKVDELKANPAVSVTPNAALAGFDNRTRTTKTRQKTSCQTWHLLIPRLQRQRQSLPALKPARRRGERKSARKISCA